MSTADDHQLKEEPNESFFRMREELQMNMALTNASVNHRLYVVVMMVSGLAAILALIISSIVFANQPGTMCTTGGTGMFGYLQNFLIWSSTNTTLNCIIIMSSHLFSQ